MKTIVEKMPERADFQKGKYTVERGFPWLTYGAVIALETILKPDFKILEFGCGGSTIFWSSRCKEVKSIETDRVWADKVQRALPNPSNVKLLCGTPEENLILAKNEPDNYYDLILVDSGKWNGENPDRKALAEAVSPKVKKGGYLVIDNYGRYRMQRFNYRGWDVYTFDHIGHYAGKGTRICIKL